MEINYSVIIRTIGTADQKYQMLLDSILTLDPPPKEIIVVLPIGSSLPQQRLGIESFYFCPKGMVQQRMYGLDKCQTPYALVCDDDISFGRDFVKQLYQPIADGLCKISVGPLLSFFVPKGLLALSSAITASSMQTLFHKNHYVKILLSGGWSFNRKIDTSSTHYYLTESAAWTCFFAEVSSIHLIDMNAESWIEKNKYAALDDQVMFYKGHCRGINTLVVSTAIYEHLDAQTSHKHAGISSKEKKLARSFNNVVFWHRFIFTQQKSLLKKVLSLLCFTYRILTSSALSIIKILLKRETIHGFQSEIRGLVAGIRYLFTPEYQKLSSVI